MGDYKQLNRELIDANRELKQTIATYQRELVLMRAELMEQHRMRVETERDFRERLLSFWAQNCLTVAREIDANVNLADFFAHNNSIQNASSNVGMRGQGDSTRSSRRSTQLVTEFRRTSAVCRPHSVVPMSPTRRHHEDNAIAEETETGTVAEQSGSDMDLDASINDGNVIDVENDETDETDDTDENGELRCIREDSEDNCEELDRTQNLIVTHNRQPIRDVTNIVMGEQVPKPHIATRRGIQQRWQNDSENSIELARDVEQDCTQIPTGYTIEMEMEDELINSMQRSLQVSHSDLTPSRNAQNANPFQNENFYKHLVVRVQRLHEARHNEVHFDKEHCIEQTIIAEDEHLVDSKRNDASTDLLLGITEFSMGNFQEASCSTPCHNKPIAVESAGSAETTETTRTLSFNSQCMRPSRRCAPRTNLAEPSLKNKLRNDSAGRKSKKR